MSRCKTTIEYEVFDETETIRCHKGDNHVNLDTETGREHGVDGLRWNDGDECPRIFRRAGLWLTAGGRVVKPGAGEYADEKFGDYLLMTADELQDGIRFKEFTRRFANAKRKWTRKHNR